MGDQWETSGRPVSEWVEPLGARLRYRYCVGYYVRYCVMYYVRYCVRY